MEIKLFRGSISDSYYMLITSGEQKVIVTIDKIQAVEVSEKLSIKIQDY